MHFPVKNLFLHSIASSNPTISDALTFFKFILNIFFSLFNLSSSAFIPKKLSLFIFSELSSHFLKFVYSSGLKLIIYLLSISCFFLFIIDINSENVLGFLLIKFIIIFPLLSLKNLKYSSIQAKLKSKLKLISPLLTK